MTPEEVLDHGICAAQALGLVTAVAALHRLAKSEDCSSLAMDSRLADLIAEIAEQAARDSAFCEPKVLSNTAWSIARLALVHEPLRASISSSALRSLS
jgi:hypothetical protein